MQQLFKANSGGQITLNGVSSEYFDKPLFRRCENGEYIRDFLRCDDRLPYNCTYEGNRRYAMARMCRGTGELMLNDLLGAQVAPYVFGCDNIYHLYVADEWFCQYPMCKKNELKL